MSKLAELNDSGFKVAIPVAGDLRLDTVFVDYETSNKAVFEIFEKNTELLNIPVTRDNRVVGLINRDNFMRSMARRFHWEIYASKHCSKMMEGEPLTIDAGTSLADLADQLLTHKHSRSLSDGFVIERDGHLIGTGMTSDVLAALLAHQRLLGYELAHANQRLHELTLTDPLTGLYNRRHFNEVITAELRRLGRGNTLLGLLMADLDHFKKLNDSLGHQAGDDALRRVATAFRTTLRRSSDYCFRLGGEEFAVLLCAERPDDLIDMGERLRNAIAGLALAHPQNPGGYLTVSIGLAIADAGADTPESLYMRADHALYSAKEGGRNRIFAVPNHCDSNHPVELA